ncbi:hypothetical protein [Streptomyces sp. NPDC048644]|uniref:hypothetical protein n=1 Tax=Streptomyces sp. NPDC048644 TaxID=3365582 RepID=UPI0037189A43
MPFKGNVTLRNVHTGGYLSSYKLGQDKDELAFQSASGASITWTVTDPADGSFVLRAGDAPGGTLTGRHYQEDDAADALVLSDERGHSPHHDVLRWTAIKDGDAYVLIDNRGRYLRASSDGGSAGFLQRLSSPQVKEGVPPTSFCWKIAPAAR